MPIIKIKLGSREFELSCPLESQDHIFNLSTKLNEQVKRFQNSNPSSSFDLALIITALNLLEAKENISKEHLGEELERINKEASEKIAIEASAKAAIEAKLEQSQMQLHHLENQLKDSQNEIALLNDKIQKQSDLIAEQSNLMTERSNLIAEQYDLITELEEKNKASENNGLKEAGGVSAIELYSNVQNLLEKLDKSKQHKLAEQSTLHQQHEQPKNPENPEELEA